MTVKYLFRLDGAKENDEFMQLSLSEGVEQVYAGIEMQIGPGWKPDFIEVACNLTESACVVTLIELEVLEADALVAARKYLPENSQDILRRLDSYIVRVVERCRATADSRRANFANLRDFLLQARTITVRTAGALRTSRSFVENLPLIDQPHSGQVVRPDRGTREHSIDFQGERLLVPRDRKNLFRALLVLDGVARGHDHSGATLKNWLTSRKQPLKIAVEKAPEQYPALDAFLRADTRSGGHVNCDGIARELSALWSKTSEFRLEAQHVSKLIERFFPAAASLRKADQAMTAFAKAKSMLSEVLPGNAPPNNRHNTDQAEHPPGEPQR